jgi:IS30 family transposase
MGYRGKLREREEARRLRAQAWTIREIAEHLGVSKSSVSLWVRDVDFERPPRPRTHGRRARRQRPNPLQVKKQEEIERLRGDVASRLAGEEQTAPLADDARREHARAVITAVVAAWSQERSRRHGPLSGSRTW